MTRDGKYSSSVFCTNYLNIPTKIHKKSKSQKDLKKNKEYKSLKNEFKKLLHRGGNCKESN